MPVTDTHVQLGAALQELEVALHNRGLWTCEPPSTAAMASVEPFACDTMGLTEWLQYIFIPRLHRLVEDGAQLPEKSDVAPMAEEYFKANPLSVSSVLMSLRRIDTLITGSAKSSLR